MYLSFVIFQQFDKKADLHEQRLNDVALFLFVPVLTSIIRGSKVIPHITFVFALLIPVCERLHQHIHKHWKIDSLLLSRTL